MKIKSVVREGFKSIKCDFSVIFLYSFMVISNIIAMYK